MKTPLIEVCVTSVEDALIAAQGGADRLELCSALEVGGVTPSRALIQDVLATVTIPVIVLVRPRPGDFHYSNRELQVILKDIEYSLLAGATGAAVGTLTADWHLDSAAWNAVMRTAWGREVVFHRAFDVVDEPEVALQQLIDCGTTRILTSGGADTAEAGINRIAHWNQLAAGRIELLPGGGIDEVNACQILRHTGCSQLHGSFSESDGTSLAVSGFGATRRTSLKKLLAVKNCLHT